MTTENADEFLAYHAAFTQPDDPSILAWRYMDMAKLLSMLLKRELYLRRLDLMPDKFEGTYPRRVRSLLANEYRKDPNLDPAQAESLANHQIEFAKQVRAGLYVSCWHLGNSESEAMWRIYCGTDGGIAVVLPYDRLRASISNGHLFIGLVKYINYESDVIIPGNTFRVALHKREEFAYEKEARILTFGDREKFTPQGGPPSMSLPWNLDLIERIVVSPYSPSWYFETIQTAVERLVPGLGVKVLASSMSAAPDSPA